MSTSEKHAWIIGASQGIGLELSRALAIEKWELTLSARSPEMLTYAAESCNAKSLVLDATDQAAMERAAAQVFSDQPPKLIVMNVGDYRPMPLSEFDAQTFINLNKTNYLTSVNLLQAVVPLMRDAGGGQILLNASAAAFRGLPNSAPYSSPKAAVIHMAECLAPELARQGIRLRVINHGFVRSRLTSKNSFPMPFLMEADEAAKRIIKAIPRNSFEISFPRRLIWPLKLLRCLPYRLYFGIVNKWILQ
jgi:short-subunit dehydrogenase